MKSSHLFVGALCLPFGLAAPVADAKLPNLGEIFTSECLGDVATDCTGLVEAAQPLIEKPNITIDDIFDTVTNFNTGDVTDKCKDTLSICVGKVAEAATRDLLGAPAKAETTQGDA